MELEQVLLAEKREQELHLQILKDRHLIEQKLVQIQQGIRIHEEIKILQKQIETLKNGLEPEDPSLKTESKKKRKR